MLLSSISTFLLNEHETGIINNGLRAPRRLDAIKFDNVCTCQTHVSNTDTRRIRIGKVFNSKNICWIFDNSSMGLTQF